MTILLAILLLTEPTKVEIHYMPLGTSLTLGTGEKVRYFKFEEYKLLLQLDSELWDANNSLDNYEALVKKLELEGVAKDAVIKTLQDDKVVMGQRLDRMEKNWNDSEKRTIAASSGPIWPYFLAAGGGVLAVVGVTLFVVTLLKPAQPVQASSAVSSQGLHPLAH